MHAKLGLVGDREGDDELIEDLLALLHAHGVDFTSCLRALSSAALDIADPARALFAEPAAFDAWSPRWRARLSSQGRCAKASADAMDSVNPMYIPRNHQVEEALTEATHGDLGPVGQLVEVLVQPFHERPDLEQYARPAPTGSGPYRTFCGT